MTPDDTPTNSRARRRVTVRSVAARSRELARRSRDVVLLAAVVGAVTGLAVAAFDTAVTSSIEQIDRLPL
ncbi:MAG TPA: hypothetical protein VKQ71_06425 [Acidimicrobiales bacterium]|nr:hypothetical protein [Acidimicrobiales bacterium]